MLKSVFIKVTLFMSLTLVMASMVYAQNQQATVYEKKKIELFLQISQRYGQHAAAFASSFIDNKSDDEVFKGAESAKVANALIGGNTTYTAIIWYANELKKIQKLKTAVDFQREKEAKAQKEQEAYEKTDAGSIKQSIKTAFEKWNQKSEFEKQIDFDERIKISSQEGFVQICMEEIEKRIKIYIHSDYDNLKSFHKFKKELSPYNTDNEFFTVTFSVNGIKGQSKIDIPLAEAENFKNRWNNLSFEINKYDWCLAENTLYPTLITFFSYDKKSKYESLISLDNRQEITVSFNDLGIDNPHLKDYVFKYSDAKIINQQILASYNNRLDSIFKDYNRQLLQNPYNIKRQTMTGYKMKSEGNREENFTSCVNSMKRDFEQLNNNFERNLKSQNPSEYCRIYFTQNPDKKTEADKKYLECRCNYSSRSKFDIQFIDKNLHGCNCREKEYQKNGNLFASKEEFDSWFDKGDSIFIPEIEKRQITAIIHKNKGFVESIDFQKEKSESSKSVLERRLLRTATGINVNEKAYSNENEARINILSLVNSSKEKSYYPQIIDLLIDTNKKLNKEWRKNGQHFENKTEFYEAYTFDYKQILKEKKKK
jgi:hypothetical protein